MLVLEKLKRAQSVLSTRRGRAVDQVAALEQALDEYLERHDPVQKADRAMKRKAKQTAGRAMERSTGPTVPQTTQQPDAQPTAEVSRQTANHVVPGALLAEKTTERAAAKSARDSSREEKSDPRRPMSAHETHSINARDRGRCTFVDANGVRCTNDRWIQRHHVVPVNLGGGNDPANLVSLCPFHHDLVHQLGFPIDGQVNWIREPSRAYRH